MQRNEIIEIFKTLADDSGLSYSDNWDDSPQTEVWRQNAVKAIEQAIIMLESGDIVGTLELNGKTYKISE